MSACRLPKFFRASQWLVGELCLPTVAGGSCVAALASGTPSRIVIPYQHACIASASPLGFSGMRFDPLSATK